MLDYMLGIGAVLLIEGLLLKRGKNLNMSDKLIIWGASTILYSLYYMISLTND